ncbi:MAG: hypothetical protein QOI95_965 [Acidimicrobiaceae bacterium]|jgi:hypothetical protein
MSFPLGVEGQAAIEAIAACDRLAPKLLELLAQHDHAATMARPDWSGPHRDAFEARFAGVERALIAGGYWVLQVRHAAVTRLAELTVQAEEAAGLIPATGPR